MSRRPGKRRPGRRPAFVRRRFTSFLSVDPPGGKLWSAKKQREYLEKAFQAIEKMIHLSKPDWSKYPSVTPAFVQVIGSVGAMHIMCPRDRAKFIEATLEAIQFEIKYRRLPYDIEGLSRRFKEIAFKWCDRKGADCIIEGIPLFGAENSFLREIARRERCSDLDGIIFFSGTNQDLINFMRSWEEQDLGTKYNDAIAKIVNPLTPEIKIEAATGYNFDKLLHPKARVTKDLKVAVTYFC